ncbi:MAG: DUF1846 family protein [Candidatus Peribacteria bacterium]|nr:MAG: DUF1846 family protein [Candidatus Peribacteria bacterium]
MKSYLRYEIQGYPENTKTILSNKGYGRDEYIPIEQSLVLVT